MKILFLYLNTFSFVGGIQKFNQNFLNALEMIDINDLELNSLSLNDFKKDLIRKTRFNHQTTEGSKYHFLVKSLLKGLKSDVIILGHVNLIFPLVLLLKLFSKKRIVLITHGIEVWDPMPFYKKHCLNKIDLIVAVSSFTKDKIIRVQGIDETKIVILPNTLDPEFNHVANSDIVFELQKKYHLKKDDKVILTVCRLSNDEQYKGYDKVIVSLKRLIVELPGIKYVIAGKYDVEEKERLQIIIQDCKLENNVILTGYVTNEELSGLYHLSNIFIMPSKMEGFGIVFLEALACGKPVIGGNRDGSVDALLNGELGLLVDPDSEEEIGEAIENMLKETVDQRFLNPTYLKDKSIETFGFDKFSERVQQLVLTKKNN